MNKLCKIASFIGLILTIAPPLLLFFGRMESLTTVKTSMFTGMIIWFTGATPWLGFKKLEPADLEVEI